MGLDSQLSTRSTFMLCLYIFFKCTCVCYLLCNTSLPAMFRNLASISARQGPSDRPSDRERESDGGQMKGGDGSARGESEREPPEGA